MRACHCWPRPNGPVQIMENRPAYIYTHCRSAMGQILCDAGRWQHAEVTLRLAGTLGASSGPRIDGRARAKLAELRVLQGRLADAERLVNDRRGHMDTTLLLVSLHLAAGEHRDAGGLARQALRIMGDDHVRAARLPVMLTEAQLALADAGAAEASVRRLDPQPAANGPCWPRAALAHGMVAQHRGQQDAQPARRSSTAWPSSPTPTGRYCSPSCGCGSARPWPAPTLPPPSRKPGRPISSGNSSDHPSRHAAPRC